MARLTINFSNKYNHLYERITKEENASQIVCKALEEYYEYQVMESGEFEDTMVSRLDMLLEKVENIEEKICK